ncbi:MAG: NUDIX domain-containing protein [Candidatus Bathyarchaeota archaeon]|nr:MAG: NUDIX domain-containing protein [Candidatus Bathyarchaeota archaeon]
MVRTRAIIFDEIGRLLVQRHSHSERDFYRLPGGGVRFREKIEDCLVREIKEETGFDVKVGRLLWVRDFLDQSAYHSIEMFFLAKIAGGTFDPTPEGRNIDLEFLDVEDLEQVVFYPKKFLPKLKILKKNKEWIDENPYIRSAN